MRELVMAVGGAALLLGSIAVFLWAAVGLAAPHMVKLSGRGQAVKLWAVSVTMLLLGTIIMPEPPPPTEAELAERRAATEAREAARAESIAERAATEAAREAERVEAREAAAREAEATSVAERERAESSSRPARSAVEQSGQARSAAEEPEPVQVSDVTFDDVNEKFGVQSDWTDLQKEREWPAYEGLCVEWTGELTSLSEGFFGGFNIQFKHLPATFVSDVLVHAPSSAEEELLTWRKGNRYRYRGRLDNYGGAFLPISLDLGCE